MDVRLRELRQCHIRIERAEVGLGEAPDPALVHPGDRAGRVSRRSRPGRCTPSAVTSTELSVFAGEYSLSRISPVAAPRGPEGVVDERHPAGIPCNDVGRALSRGRRWRPGGASSAPGGTRTRSAGSSGDAVDDEARVGDGAAGPVDVVEPASGQAGGLDLVDEAIGSHVDAVRRDVDDRARPRA